MSLTRRRINNEPTLPNSCWRARRRRQKLLKPLLSNWRTLHGLTIFVCIFHHECKAKDYGNLANAGPTACSPPKAESAWWYYFMTSSDAHWLISWLELRQDQWYHVTYTHLYTDQCDKNEPWAIDKTNLFEEYTLEIWLNPCPIYQHWGGGFITYTVASHQGAIQLFWPHFDKPLWQPSINAQISMIILHVVSKRSNNKLQWMWKTQKLIWT